MNIIEKKRIKQDDKNSKKTVALVVDAFLKIL